VREAQSHVTDLADEAATAVEAATQAAKRAANADAKFSQALEVLEKLKVASSHFLNARKELFAVAGVLNQAPAVAAAIGAAKSADATEAPLPPPVKASVEPKSGGVSQQDFRAKYDEIVQAKKDDTTAAPSNNELSGDEGPKNGM